MGCDIHLYTEYLRHVDGKPIWINCDNWQVNPYYKDDNEPKYEINPLYGGRNYHLFAILANVRNEDDGNEYISEPRGVPDDMSPQTKDQYDKWDSDGHSHSYLSLAELKEFEAKHIPIKFSGMMTAENARLVDIGQMPNEWCRGTNNSAYVHRKWELHIDYLAELITLLEARKKEVFNIYANDDTTRDNQIRIVFWFDN
jgi:hypothetical protein